MLARRRVQQIGTANDLIDPLRCIIHHHRELVGVQAVGAARAGQFINLVPVSGVLFGRLLLDEVLTASLLLGGMLVVAGLLLATRSGAARFGRNG